MDSLTLIRHNSFQNQSNWKSTHTFASRPLIFKLQKEDLKFNDISVSWSSPKSNLENNFLGFAKLRAFGAYVPYVPMPLTCLRASNYYVPTCLSVWNYYVSSCLCAWNYYVPTCLRAFVPTCLRALRVSKLYVPLSLNTLIYKPSCPLLLRAYVP